MIHELLCVGSDSPTTGRQLARVLGVDIRNVTAAIQRERRQGWPICCYSNPDNAGYFLADDPEQIENYCCAIRHRAGELHKTRRALLDILKRVSEGGGLMPTASTTATTRQGGAIKC